MDRGMDRASDPDPCYLKGMDRPLFNCFSIQKLLIHTTPTCHEGMDRALFNWKAFDPYHPDLPWRYGSGPFQLKSFRSIPSRPISDMNAYHPSVPLSLMPSRRISNISTWKECWRMGLPAKAAMEAWIGYGSAMDRVRDIKGSWNGKPQCVYGSVWLGLL